MLTLGRLVEVQVDASKQWRFKESAHHYGAVAAGGKDNVSVVLVRVVREVVEVEVCCAACGKRLIGGNAFCIECGKPVM